MCSARMIRRFPARRPRKACRVAGQDRVKGCGVRKDIVAVLALVASVLIWGTTFVVSASTLASLSPAALTVARFAVALLLLGPLAAGRGGLGHAVRSGRVAALGATGVAAYFGLQNIGLLTTSAGTAALLQAALPVAIAVLAATCLRERYTARVVVGLILATAGVVLVAGGDRAGLGPGAVLILLGVLGYAIYTVLLRGQPDSDPIVLATATCMWGLLWLLPWQVWEIAVGAARLSLDRAAALSVLYLGVAASALTLLLWTYGASRLPGSTSGAFTAMIPAVGYVCAVLSGESATSAKTAGSFLAVFGTVLVMCKRAGTMSRSHHDEGVNATGLAATRPIARGTAKPDSPPNSG